MFLECREISRVQWRLGRVPWDELQFEPISCWWCVAMEECQKEMDKMNLLLSCCMAPIIEISLGSQTNHSSRNRLLEDEKSCWHSSSYLNCACNRGPTPAFAPVLTYWHSNPQKLLSPCHKLVS
ncbi:ryanodine receptor 3-like protein [Striga asiatica]|uniref:Ryanodine receptor 3-like protein n=1 Tax=Striga asiatica TaxID=4170 RepID=A0A5A7P8K5_STRAF|nr:ryanodine receptor 3-like protein [Striga asiatica]